MRVLSGIQPTGRFHWGNYFGAIRQYIDLQDEEESYYEEEGAAASASSAAKNLLVALPNPDVLNVGLAEEEWPLSTHQFANMEITLSFFSSSSNNVTSTSTPSVWGLRKIVPRDFAKCASDSSHRLQRCRPHWVSQRRLAHTAGATAVQSRTLLR